MSVEVLAQHSVGHGCRRNHRQVAVRHGIQIAGRVAVEVELCRPQPRRQRVNALLRRAIDLRTELGVRRKVMLAQRKKPASFSLESAVMSFASCR